MPFVLIDYESLSSWLILYFGVVIESYHDAKLFSENSVFEGLPLRRTSKVAFVLLADHHCG